MPGCTAGSAPTAGCEIHGANLNWLVTLAILAILGSFFTVPLGAFIALVGLILFVHKGRSRGRRPFGIYDCEDRLLNIQDAEAAIARFDRNECDMLLRSFGNAPAFPEEPIEVARSRCIEVLKSCGAYAA
jgi:hypothetical protein